VEVLQKLQALQQKKRAWFGACKATALHIGDFPYVLSKILFSKKKKKGKLFFPNCCFFIENETGWHRKKQKTLRFFPTFVVLKN
jgi:hypothetical protein